VWLSPAACVTREQEQATTSQQASKAAAVERLKHNLRQHGALARLAQVAADAIVAPGGPCAAAKQLHLLLAVLENATFTCPDNGAALVRLQLVPGGKSGSGSRPSSQQEQQQRDGDDGGAAATTPGGAMSFPAVVVSIVQALRQDTAACPALHVALSVLMNLSHQNPTGGAAISRAGGLAAAAGTLLQLLQPRCARLCCSTWSC
jgi:hypothetical protein